MGLLKGNNLDYFSWIVIHDEKKVGDLFVTGLQHEFGGKLYGVESADEAIRTLDEIDFKVNGIISKNKIKEEKTSYKVLKYLKKNGYNIPVIVLGAFKPIEDVGAYNAITHNFSIEEIYEILRKENKLSESFLEKDQLPDYVQIPIHYFFSATEATTDVFIKVKQPDRDRYLKRIHKGDLLDKESFLRYNEKFGLNFLCVPKDERRSLLNNIIKQVLHRLQDKELSQGERTEILSDAFDIGHDVITEEGYTEQNAEIVAQTIDALRETVKSNKKVSNLLGQLLSSKGSYKFKRTQLMIDISARVLPKMEWASTVKEDDPTFQKVLYYSYFHDIFLKEDKHLKIHFDYQFKDANLTNSERQLVETHAQKAGEIVNEFPALPIGLGQLIACHHGTASGLGFAQAYSNSLPMITKFLIVIEYFVYYFLDADGDDKKVKLALSRMHSVFSKKDYKVVVEALEEFYQKNKGLLKETAQ